MMSKAEGERDKYSAWETGKKDGGERENDRGE